MQPITKRASDEKPMLRRLDDYTRVSSIASLLTDFSSIPAEILEAAAERGTAVHKLCSAHVRKLPVFDIHPDAAPYVASFKEWFKNQVQEVVACDMRYWCDEYMLTGEVDMVVKLNSQEGLTLVDLKTSARRYPSWDLQCAGYRYLLKLAGTQIDRALIVRLKKDGGKAIVNQVENLNEAETTFFCLLKAAKYLNIKAKYEVE